MKSKPLVVLAVALALAAAGGSAWWWRETGLTQATVAGFLPPLPDLAAAPAALRDRLIAADTRATSRTDATAGLIELSRLYHANGYLATAMRCYEGLEKLQPDEPRWPHRHASILAGFGEAAPALALWQQVLTLAPDYLPARLRVADLLLKTNDRAGAASAYEEVLARDANDPYAQLGLARLDLEAERWTEARRRLEKVVGQTNYNLGYDLIVSLYERLGLDERAAAIRGRAAASGAYRDPADPWIDDLLNDCYDSFRLALEAGTKARSGDPAEGIRLLNRAIAVAPNDLSAHFQLGGLLLQQRDAAGAMEQFRRCTQLDPEFSDGWAQLSGLLAQTGRAAEAASTLATGLEHCPDSPGLHLMKARNFRAANQPAAALPEYRTAIRLRPNEPDPYLEYGTTLIGLGRTADGVRQVETALIYDPANPAALGIMAFSTIEAGDRAAADHWMQKIDAQPRIDRAQADRLRTAYRAQFGSPWLPAAPTP